MNKIRKFGEDWIRWDPGISNLGLNGNYSIESVSDNCESFVVLLKHESSDKVVEIVFSGQVLASRHVDEGLRSVLFADLSHKYGDAFYAQWTFFKVKKFRFAAMVFQM